METLHPGLYLQEVKGEAPIEGVSTSVGAFVGTAIKGEIGKANLVTSWNDFVSKYGSYDVNSYLAYAVRGFFDNGGTKAFISRVVKTTGGVKASKKSSAEVGGVTPYLLVEAKTDGTDGDNYFGQIVNVDAVAKTFDFLIFYKGDLVESMIGTTLAELDNAQLEHVLVNTLVEDGTPVQEDFKLENGDNGIVGITALDYVGDEVAKTGIYAFGKEKINLLAVPGITDVAVHTAISDYVDKRGDAFAILEVPLGKSVIDAQKYKLTEANLSSPNVAIYYSWISVSDPIGVGNAPTKMIPPSGHIMGVYARTDAERGVFKAPAGTDAKVRGALGLEINVEDVEQDLLNPHGINSIRAFDGEGIILWGARTTQPGGQFRYVNVRRSLLFINQSILASTRWAVFENNDTVLWGKIKTAIETFLRGFWNAGGLKGVSEGEAFFVVCDDTTTTKADVELGKLYAHYGVSPQRPAEFIIFKVSIL